MTRHSHRDGLLTYVLTVDPQWDGSVMVHTDIEARDDPGFASSICVEAPLLDALIADLIGGSGRAAERAAASGENRTGASGSATEDRVMIEVKWSMTDTEDPFVPIATDRYTFLGDWARVESNAVAAAREIAEDFWRDDDMWSGHIGDDECGEVRLVIASPSEIAGAYEIELTKVVRADVRRIA